jgi:hypothetical protein
MSFDGTKLRRYRINFKPIPDFASLIRASVTGLDSQSLFRRPLAGDLLLSGVGA